jgi:signal transduction histidine kinase
MPQAFQNLDAVDGHRFDGARRQAFAFAEALVENLDLDQRYVRLAERTATMLSPAGCVVFAYDPADHLLLFVAEAPSAIPSLSGMRLDLRDADRLGDLRQRLSADPADLVPYSSNQEQFRCALDTGYSVAVPMTHRHELIGMLLIVTPGRTSEYSADELDLLRDIAEVGSRAVFNARQYRNAMRGQGRLEALLTRLWEVREQERKAFASMVHDDILQAVVGTIYALDGLRDAVAESALDDYDYVLRALRMSVEDARKIIWELRPAVLDGLGLAEALGAIADRIAVEGKAAVTTSLKQLPGLGEALSTGIYKIGREALLNAERHANARRIDIALRVEHGPDGRQLLCSVTDDGCGYDADAERARGHYGLVMMEEQAVAIGGVLEVESRKGHGTRVSITVPVLDQFGEDHEARS